MTINKSLYSSNKQDWETPQDLFDALNAEFNFSVDLCATEQNKKCEVFVEDIFSYWPPFIPWVGRKPCAYMNPPYGRGIGKFIERAWTLCSFMRIVCLLPARTDTKYWHQYIWDDIRHCKQNSVKEIRFLKGRLKFSGHKNSAPFPSVIVVFER